MKRIYITVQAILLLIILYSDLKAWDTTAAKYFPLNVGNTWYYKTTYSPSPFPPTFHKDFIEKDSIIDGKKYFKYFQYGLVSYIRFDSTSGNLIAYSYGNGCGSYTNDKIIDSLNSSIGNLIYCYFQDISIRGCISIGTESVFGIISETKEFHHNGSVNINLTYSKNFGIIHSCTGEPGPCSGFSDLIGCKINGVVYGDTTLTGVNLVNSSIPDKFSLSQNYPNPFNPLTVISYQLAVSNVVNLKVYDALGKEVATLVNEKQNAGSYSVEFNGEGLPSGVYFYKLETGDFVETKRMILLK